MTRRMTLRTVLLLAFGLSLSGGCSSNPPGTIEHFRVVRPAIAFEMMRDTPSLVVFDLRPENDFRTGEGHIKGAHNVEVETLGRLCEKLGVSRDDTVLVYDAEGGERQREAVAHFLDRGQRFVVQIEGGLAGWRAQGYGVVRIDTGQPAQVAVTSD